MPTKKKTNTKLTKSQLLIAIVLLLVGAILIFLIAKVSIEKQQKNQTLHEQKVRLDAAERDLNVIGQGLLGGMISGDVQKKTFAKDCSESSTKFGRGTITCGPSFSIVIFSDRPIADLVSNETKLETVLTREPSFTGKSMPYSKDATTNTQKEFEITSHYGNSSSTKCYFDVDTYTANQYKMLNGVDSSGRNAQHIVAGCNEITKEPIYPLAD